VLGVSASKSIESECGEQLSAGRTQGGWWGEQFGALEQTRAAIVKGHPVFLTDEQRLSQS
jgi:hypothetical protein